VLGSTSGNPKFSSEEEIRAMVGSLTLGSRELNANSLEMLEPETSTVGNAGSQMLAVARNANGLKCGGANANSAKLTATAKG
jgi:hypothetical protein